MMTFTKLQAIIKNNNTDTNENLKTSNLSKAPSQRKVLQVKGLGWFLEWQGINVVLVLDFGINIKRFQVANFSFQAWCMMHPQTCWKT